jgi:hypothetical protein
MPQRDKAALGAHLELPVSEVLEELIQVPSASSGRTEVHIGFDNGSIDPLQERPCVSLGFYFKRKSRPTGDSVDRQNSLANLSESCCQFRRVASGCCWIHALVPSL